MEKIDSKVAQEKVMELEPVIDSSSGKNVEGFLKLKKIQKINEFKEKLVDLIEEYHSYFCLNDEFFDGIREVEKQANIEKQQHLNR